MLNKLQDLQEKTKKLLDITFAEEAKGKAQQKQFDDALVILAQLVQMHKDGTVVCHVVTGEEILKDLATQAADLLGDVLESRSK